MEKKELRKKAKRQITSVSVPYFHECNQKILEKVLDLTAWKEAKTVGVTISRKMEIDTINLIEEGWRAQKIIVVPKTIKETKQMEFYQLRSWDMLEETYAGLLEPITAGERPVKKEVIDFLVVPGLAFDLKGYRIGFGGGYYDRFLTDYKGTTCAMALNEQIFESVPHDTYDIPVQVIVTPTKVHVSNWGN